MEGRKQVAMNLDEKTFNRAKELRKKTGIPVSHMVDKGLELILKKHEEGEQFKR